MNSKCDNCGWKGEPLVGLEEIPDLLERIEEGGVVPSGECADCGCLCYPIRLDIATAHAELDAGWEEIKRLLDEQAKDDVKPPPLLDFMAKACHYAQEHIDNDDTWPTDELYRERYLQCVSYQMACFFAQNTVFGECGVEFDVVLKELTEHPMKSEEEWTRILDAIAGRLGGWK